jgi:hypothetical protein
LRQNPPVGGKNTDAHVSQREAIRAGSGPVVNHPSMAGPAAPVVTSLIQAPRKN